MNKTKLLLIGSLVILIILVALEEFMPGWDGREILDAIALVQTFAVAGIAFLLGRNWDE